VRGVCVGGLASNPLPGNSGHRPGRSPREFCRSPHTLGMSRSSKVAGFSWPRLFSTTGDQHVVVAPLQLLAGWFCIRSGSSVGKMIRSYTSASRSVQYMDSSCRLASSPSTATNSHLYQYGIEMYRGVKITTREEEDRMPYGPQTNLSYRHGMTSPLPRTMSLQKLAFPQAL
jgi:hypothetical protein